MYEEDIQLKASQVELLVDASKGIGRMALAQPPGAKAVELLDFTGATAGKTCQMHNQGLFDEYRNLVIEADPKQDRLITAQWLAHN